MPNYIDSWCRHSPRRAGIRESAKIPFKVWIPAYAGTAEKVFRMKEVRWYACVLSLLVVFFFFERIECFFGKEAVAADHIGDKGKDETLQSDEEEYGGEKEPIAVRGDFEFLKIEGEKNNKERE